MRLKLVMKEHDMNYLQHTDAAKVTEALDKTTSLVLCQPFDMARAQYAFGVRAGLIEDSLLACARFGRDISSLEKLTLGPWARHV
jgi:hypothetical protein